MKNKDLTLFCVNQLKNEYPDASCALNSENPFELLAATRLSAQCTDARVNKVTPMLFAKYRTIEDYAGAELSDVEDIVRSCGFYHTKAENIIAAAKEILARFDGKVPDNIDDLITLPGVGRKTANLIVGDVYGKPAAVVDTHMIRLSNRIGLVDTKDPVKIEIQLKEYLPPEESSDFCHRIVLHGRAVCPARSPKCEICCLAENCKKRI